MISYERPLYLLLLLLIIPGIYFQFFRRNRGGRFLFPFRFWGGNGFYPTGGGLRFFLILSGIMYWTGMAFLIVALAGPVSIKQKKIYLNEGKEIIFVLDQSPSMAATDFPPDNRFETAKNMIGKFIQGRVNDSIGLVGFGEDAVLRVPPTTDYDFLLNRLSEMQIMELGDGTAIGMGLSVATLHLSRGSGKEKIVVLLTDGDNNAGEIQPEMAARIASELGIKVYCIGIGSKGEVPVDLINPKTGQRLKGLLNSEFNEPLLKTISEKTGGGYFKAVSPGILETIFQTIDTMETTEIKIKIQVEKRPLYRKFILIGFAVIFFNFIFRKIFLREVL